ncbi:MAG: protein-tyrosine-phosphatase [Cyclobacteriaceae bacterium]
MIPNESKKGVGTLLLALMGTVERIRRDFDKIPEDRKNLLSELADFIGEKVRVGQPVSLNFICTHNSRRSHMAQLWAQAAAYHYGVRGVTCYSGGTEATAFNPRAVEAMRNVGFQITKTSDGANPSYEVIYSKEAPALKVFSKRYNDPVNPAKDFAAIMTCSHADQNCPLVLGASKRIAITYDDPKDFDDTPVAETKYRERAVQIGTEMLYVFARVK